MKNILVSSILFTIMFLLLALFRKINYCKYRKQTFRLLWILLIIRLLIPNSLFGFSIPIKTISAALTHNISVDMANIIYRTQTYSIPFIFYFTKIWWVGFILSVSILTLHYINFRVKLKKSFISAFRQDGEELADIYQLPIQVKISNENTSPFVTGIFNKILVLPRRLLDSDNQEDLYYIISHEMIHIRRKDNLVKILYLVARCIHWFNHFVYIMGGMLNMDMETSCDEAIAAKLNKNERIEYCKVLYKHCTRQNTYSYLYNTSFSTNGSKMKERFDSILGDKRKYGTGLLIICLLLILGTIILKFDSTQNSSEVSGAKLSYTTEASSLKYSGDQVTIVITGKLNDTYKVFENTLEESEYIDLTDILGREDIIKNISDEDLKRLSGIQVMIWKGKNK